MWWILQVTAQAGQQVTIVDQKQELLDKSIQGIRGSLTRLVKKKFADDAKVYTRTKYAPSEYNTV